MSRPRLISVDVLYRHLDQIGVMPEFNQRFPCDEAPSGSLLVVEKKHILCAGQPIGWTLIGEG
jgi:hypothetical protein